MEKSDGIELGHTGTRKTFSKCQWWVNWITVIFIQVLVSVTYGIVMPSLHQFVTNERENEITKNLSNVVYHQSESDLRNLSNNSSSDLQFYSPQAPNSQSLLWPGLSLSEFMYSWVVTSYSIGEVLGAFIGGFLSSLLSYRLNIFLSNVILIIGGCLYALTVHASMIIMARFLMGVHCGYGLVLLTSYIGVTTDQLEEDKKESCKPQAEEGKENSSELSLDSKKFKKKNTTLKDWLFGVYSLLLSVSYPLTPGICALMSSFSHLNPFHWPGWFVVVMTVVYLGVFTLIFKEATPLFSRPTYRPKQTIKNKASVKCTCSTGKQIVMYTILAMASFMAGSLCAARDVLMNPLLGDQFGFRISDMSYFMLAVMSIMVLGLLFQYTVKFFSFPNRAVLIIVFIVGIVGGLLLSDWQSIGDDPCNLTESELTLPLNLSNSTTPSQNHTYLEQLCLDASNTTISSHNQCYWNPRSRITGQFCAECHPVCRSFQKSLNFVQFFIGLSVVICMIILGQVFVSVVTSDYTPLEYQGVMMGVIFTAAGLSRFVSPMFVDWAYEATDKHTYIPLSVMNFALLVMVVILVIVYKELAPKKKIESKNKGTYTHMINLNKNEKNNNHSLEESTSTHELRVASKSCTETKLSQEQEEQQLLDDQEKMTVTVASNVCVWGTGCEDVCSGDCCNYEERELDDDTTTLL